MWRILPFTTGGAAWQLEQTERLRLEVAEEEAGETAGAVRWYGYDREALVLGVGQQAQVVDGQAAERGGVEVVKRTSGGGVVLATPDMVALDVALPASSPLAIQDVVESYRWAGEAFLAALRKVVPRAPVELVPVAEARADKAAQEGAASETAERLRGMACFGTLSPYEVAVTGEGVPARKLIGLSQVRKRGVVLHQVGFYVRFSGAQMARYLAVDEGLRPALGEELDRRIASLEDVGLGREGVPALMAAVNEVVGAL